MTRGEYVRSTLWGCALGFAGGFLLFIAVRLALSFMGGPVISRMNALDASFWWWPAAGVVAGAALLIRLKSREFQSRGRASGASLTDADCGALIDAARDRQVDPLAVWLSPVLEHLRSEGYAFVPLGFADYTGKKDFAAPFRAQDYLDELRRT